MEPVAFTFEIGVVLAVLGLTVFLFASEIVRIDVSAISIMVLLGVLGSLPVLEEFVEVSELFHGFASNAVISIVAVMIVGAGLDRTGVMTKVAGWIMRAGGEREKGTVALISVSVGAISGFMQNVGAAALFIPVVSRISGRTGLSMSRMLMPMGFCAILGGTLTMVGSSPLILLNDLIAGANATLPPEQQMAPFGLFSVTPVGIALVLAGLTYFLILGPLILPRVGEADEDDGLDAGEYFRRITGFDRNLYEVEIPAAAPIQGKPLGTIERDSRVHVVAVHEAGSADMEPGRDAVIDGPIRLALMATPEALADFAASNGLIVHDGLELFAADLDAAKAGIAELVIPVESKLIGQSSRSAWMRKTYGLSLLSIHRRGEVLNKENTDLGGVTLEEGDTIVCYTVWDALSRLERDRNFVVVTTDYPREEVRPQKVGVALFFFAVAMLLVIFTDLRLSLCLLIGATGMVLGKVLTIDEAYDAVSWKTVFLLASLIPLGATVQATGTAEWIAVQVLSILGDVPLWVLQATVAVLATLFTLVMSNVGATVLLVPLAVSIALAAGGDPAVFALTVAISTSNSFLIPTHQVNALIMGPGGYRVSDFIRAGGIMTVLFLVVSLLVLGAWY